MTNFSSTHRKSLLESIAHADLSDMPDTANVVSDHDSRYLKLDASNGPLTGDLDLGANDLTTTGEITANVFDMPLTTGATVGVINQNDSSFIHTYNNNLAQTEQNLFIGYNAGNFTFSNATYGRNVGIGYNALHSLTTGINNVALGRVAGDAITSGSHNFALGTGSLTDATTSSSNIAIGTFALFEISTGSYNIGIGRNAGVNLNTTSAHNVLIGTSTFDSSDNVDYVCNYNTIIGSYAAGNFKTAIDDNVFIGYRAGYTAQGNANVFLGKQAGYFNTGSGNVFLGKYAGYNETGSNLLYIDNSSTTTPLIYGDFSADTLKINGTFEANGYTKNIVTKTANYTLTASDDIVLGDTNAFTLTLPTAAGIAGKVYTIKKINTEYDEALTIDGNGAELIEDAQTYVINTVNSGITIISDGTQWWVTSVF